jgi:hypothetical protein
MHEFPPENLRNPARERRAGSLHQLRSGQLDSTDGKKFITLAARRSRQPAEKNRTPALAH